MRRLALALAVTSLPALGTTGCREREAQPAQGVGVGSALSQAQPPTESSRMYGL